MSFPRLDPTNSGSPRLMSAPMPSSSDAEGREGVNSARLGVTACILFMGGGLYWTASVGLLTLSALKAYPVMICAGVVVIALFILATTFWTSWRADESARSLLRAGEANTPCIGTYDSVTGLPTKRLFSSILQQGLGRARRNGRHVAVLVVEMDHFTLTAELQGQVNRNLIYRVQAARLKSALRTTDCVARWAERTFAVLLEQVKDPEEVIATAKKMQLTVSLPFTLEGHEIFLTSRIGIGLSTCEDDKGMALIESATQAVAAARAEGLVLYGLQSSLLTSPVDSSSTIAA